MCSKLLCRIEALENEYLLPPLQQPDNPSVQLPYLGYVVNATTPSRHPRAF